MTTPDEQEQALSPTGDLAPSSVPDLPTEASEADVLEQAAPAAPQAYRVDRELPLEVPEADALAQAEVVPFDEDDERG